MQVFCYSCHKEVLEDQECIVELTLKGHSKIIDGKLYFHEKCFEAVAGCEYLDQLRNVKEPAGLCERCLWEPKEKYCRWCRQCMNTLSSSLCFLCRKRKAILGTLCVDCFNKKHSQKENLNGYFFCLGFALAVGLMFGLYFYSIF